MAGLVVDLYCGIGGWSKGFIAEGYDCVGFDIERHAYGDLRYPGGLVLQDVRTLCGSQFRHCSAIVASPPCQEYSYMAMPWSKAKEKAREIRAAGFAGLSRLNALFLECFRLQSEASLAAGRHVPLIVENVKGAQPWVGRARAHYGSFYLWGDVASVGNRVYISVPGLPIWGAGLRSPAVSKRPLELFTDDGGGAVADRVNGGGDWFSDKLNPFRYFKPDSPGTKQNGSGETWFDIGIAARSSQSSARKAASAQIAEIPLDLARHVAKGIATIDRWRLAGA